MLAVVLVILKFQSTLPHGSDRGEASSRCRAVHFNPRSLAGATCFAREAICITINFNPRSLAGATEAKERILKHRQISIHAPLRERLYAIVTRALSGKISIHAPLRERRAPFLYLNSGYADFNPRSLAGATQIVASCQRRDLAFQSTLPCGSDRSDDAEGMFEELFQSTLPCGSDC